MRQMVPVRSGMVRESLNMRRAELAREVEMQPGVITWIETGRFIPYDNQIEKIAKVYRSRGWRGETSSLLDEIPDAVEVG
ncbi:helix-turn-helix domain-containing protein [Olsenella phocaeensis]|uniref:helix-turn-helix domain-containing protein n=1 Tax=Olsenella phocaeensis TaxID=1852385 RepID=UPI003A8E58D9